MGLSNQPILTNEPTGPHSLHALIGAPIPPFPFNLEKRDRLGKPHQMLVRDAAELKMYAPDDIDNVAQLIEGRLMIVSTVE